MKTVLIIRHAKSSWDLSTHNDFDRPLNERGKHDAPLMSQRLLLRNVAIDLFISSPAKRAKKTAQLFCKEYKCNEQDILYKSELYHASPQTFFEVIEKTSEGFKNIALFSHNPGITYFVNELTDTKIDNMPTCGIFAIKFNDAPWKEFSKAKKEFWFFDYPKALDHV